MASPLAVIASRRRSNPVSQARRKRSWIASPRFAVNDVLHEVGSSTYADLAIDRDDFRLVQSKIMTAI
jgi:hypothetical protein